MKATGKTSIVIEFDRVEDKDEIEDLAHFFIKCRKESKKSGFTNLFDQRDRDIIEKFIKNVGLYEEDQDR